MCIIPDGSLGYRLAVDFQHGADAMADTNTQEQLSRGMLALFLIGGSLGAIIMSWIAYSAMIGHAL